MTERPAAAHVARLRLDSFGYDAQPVLGALELVVRAGETVAVTGPSGIGKTSLLRILAGLETGFRGERDVPGRVSVVFQEPTLLPWRTARENLRLTTGLDAAGADAALAEVGLRGLGARFPGRLSLGQQRRLSLARAFGAEPDLLLMDEPFVSLDPALAEEMMGLFARLRAARGIATVLVTHAEAEARKLADRILTLGGRPARVTAERANRPALMRVR